MKHENDCNVTRYVKLEGCKYKFMCTICSLDDSRLVLKQVIFSDTLEGRRKSESAVLSWRHSIAQDTKFIGLQDKI